MTDDLHRNSHVPIARIALLLLVLVVWPSLALGERPNVIMFVVDDLNDWVSPMGDTQAITPNMDRLAKRGVTFTNAHAPGVFCAPSRTAIWTGLHASTTGCYSTQVYFYDRPDIQPMQAAFQNAGYKTFGGGKLYHHRPGYLDRRGWTEYFVHSDHLKQEGWSTQTWTDESPFPQPHPSSPYNQDGRKLSGGLFMEWGRVPNDKEEEMADTKRTNWAVDVIQRKHNQPFFLSVGLYTPHFPNYAPAKYYDLYDRDKIKLPELKADDLDDIPEPQKKRMMNRDKIRQRLVKLGIYEDAVHAYLACSSYADAMLGRVLDALDKSPHADNTIVVLWSDHGYHLGQKGQWGKHTLWERTSNIPFIVAGGPVAKGAKVDATVSLIDLYPTFADLCRLEQPKQLDGTSIAQTLLKPSTAKDRYVLVPDMNRGAYAIINRDWRYIRYQNGTEELYDLSADPNEWKNLATRSKYAEVKQRLAKLAPAEFAPEATALNKLRLETEGEEFRWIDKTHAPSKK